jgi:hypothetical protein
MENKKDYFIIHIQTNSVHTDNFFDALRSVDFASSRGTHPISKRIAHFFTLQA